MKIGFLNGEGHNLGQGLLSRLVKWGKNAKFPLNKKIIKLLNLEVGEKITGFLTLPLTPTLNPK